LDAQSAGVGRERDVGVETVAVMTSNNAEHAAAVDAPVGAAADDALRGVMEDLQVLACLQDD